MRQDEDRRRYYRVDDRAALRYIRLADEASLSGELSDLSLQSRLAELDLMLDQALARLAEVSPEARDVADLLDRKLALALEACGAGLSREGPASLVTREVNLGAGGFAFRTDEIIEVGENLLIDLLFYPERRTVRALARVVAITSDGGEGRFLRVDIERMTDADREILMGHIMRLQSAQLRKREDVPGNPEGF